MYGGTEKFRTDPYWRDHLLLYEYFHGDNGAGLGASHQTGWTGLVAKLIQLYGCLDPKEALEAGRAARVRTRLESGGHPPLEMRQDISRSKRRKVNQLSVQLPEPAAKRPLFRQQVLRVYHPRFGGKFAPPGKTLPG